LSSCGNVALYCYAQNPLLFLTLLWDGQRGRVIDSKASSTAIAVAARYPEGTVPDSGLQTKVPSRNWQLRLDAFERVSLTALYAWLVVRCIIQFLPPHNWVALFPVVSEGLVLVLVLIRRRSTAISTRPGDWLLGWMGTTLPLFVQPSGGVMIAPLQFPVFLLLAGMAMQLSAKLTLQRSFGLVAANRGITVRGLYRVIRHPIYAGYILAYVGFFLANANLWNAGLYLVCVSLHIARIFVEERLLKEDPAYLRFAADVPYRLIPFIF